MEGKSHSDVLAGTPLSPEELRNQFDHPFNPSKGLRHNSIERETNMEAKLFPKLTRAAGLRLLSSLSVQPPYNATLENVKISLVAALRLRYADRPDSDLDDVLAPLRRKVYQRNWLLAQAAFYGGYGRPRETATVMELRCFLQRLYVMEGLDTPPPEVLTLEEEAACQHVQEPSAGEIETERLRFKEQLRMGKTAAYLAQHFPRQYIPMWGQLAAAEQTGGNKKRKIDGVLAFGVYRKAELKPIIEAAATAGLLVNYMEGQKGAWVVHLSRDTTMLERAVDDSRRALARRSGSILRAHERMLLSEEEAEQKQLERMRKEALRLNKEATAQAFDRGWNVRGSWNIRSEAGAEKGAESRMILMMGTAEVGHALVGYCELSGWKGYMLFERTHVGEDNSTISLRWMRIGGGSAAGTVEEGRLTFSEEGSKVDGWLGDSQRGDIDLEGWLSGSETANCINEPALHKYLGAIKNAV